MAAFSRKHYQAVAAMFAPHHNEYVVRELVRQFADMFAADNPRFDRARFLAACGVEG